ncbi:MAG: hypothetical protein L0271_26690, partial [Gemmatimonadetes bacterium]|nr:hypothetical protein [Gemmatimonadota bacterium]
MRRLYSAIICATLLGFAAAAEAQTGKVSLEGRGGFTVPRSELARAGASNGFASAIELMYSVHPAVSIYGGVSRDEFDGEFSSTGFQSGAKLILTRDGSFMPWAGAGL